eukprot:superscaffoldBa00000769_g7116
MLPLVATPTPLPTQLLLPGTTDHPDTDKKLYLPPTCGTCSALPPYSTPSPSYIPPYWPIQPQKTPTPHHHQQMTYASMMNNPTPPLSTTVRGTRGNQRDAPHSV